MTRQRGDRATVAERQRQARAVALRAEGRTYEVIAERLEYASRSSAHRAVMALLRRQESADADLLRRLENVRLDSLTERLCAELAAIPVGADPTATVRLVAGLLRISERRSRLHGLDRDAGHWVAANPGADDRLEALKVKLNRWMESVEAAAGQPIDAEIFE